MADRRHSLRYAFLDPPGVRALTVNEVVIESLDDRGAVLTTAHAFARGDRVVVQFTSPSGGLTTRVARVLSCTPATLDNSGSWRLNLSISPTDASSRS